MPPVATPREALSAFLSSRSTSFFAPIERGSILGKRAILSPRLATGVSTVPEGYGRAPFGPDAGTVVGIVLGSIAGFLLVLWLIYTCVNLGNPSAAAAVVETGSVGGGGGSASVVSRHSKPRVHRHPHRASHASRRHSHSSSHNRHPRETVEIRRTERIVPAPMTRPVTPGSERIVVEEDRRARSISRPPPPPMAPRIVPDDDDEIVVLEEHTPPRRRDSRKQRRRSSGGGGGGGGTYRDVDPYRFGGGDAPLRDVSRRRSRSRR